MKALYVGPLMDYSGYGEANRNAVAALDAAGVDMTIDIVNYTSEMSEFGKIGKLIIELKEKTGDSDVVIIHTTPDEYQRLMRPGKYHIGHFFWETSRIPKEFVEGLNLMNEVWTGSKANRQAMQDSGVTVPIFIFPQAIDTSEEFPEPNEIPGMRKDSYLFYSIFEWTDRKNPQALLKAYLEEFQSGEDVNLLIKTYFRNFTLQNKRMIRNQVAKIKSEIALEKYPPLFLYLELMDKRQIARVHSTGDCFVSAHRGEGWGVPQVEAALAGNPIISTNYGGCHEYFTDGENAMLTENKMVSLTGMDHAKHWYTPDQKWADVDVSDLRKRLRWSFENRTKGAVTMGNKAQELVKERFSLKTVGKAMADRLTLIKEDQRNGNAKQDVD